MKTNARTLQRLVEREVGVRTTELRKLNPKQRLALVLEARTQELLRAGADAPTIRRDLDALQVGIRERNLLPRYRYGFDTREYCLPRRPKERIACERFREATHRLAGTLAPKLLPDWGQLVVEHDLGPATMHALVSVLEKGAGFSDGAVFWVKSRQPEVQISAVHHPAVGLEFIAEPRRRKVSREEAVRLFSEVLQPRGKAEEMGSDERRAFEGILKLVFGPAREEWPVDPFASPAADTFSLV